jgi:hypothetical protein
VAAILRRNKSTSVLASLRVEPTRSIVAIVSRLPWRARKRLPRSDFAIPEKAPGPGSYPIPDRAHARNALARVAQFGTPSEKRRVREAVHRKYPDIEEGET